MRVLTIIGAGEFGGAEQHVYDLLRSSKESEPHLAVFYDGVLAEKIRLLGKPVIVLPKGMFAAINEVADYVKQYDIHMIHTHGARANLIGRLASQRTGVPNMTTVHSVFRYDYSNWLKRGVLFQLEKWSRRYVDHYICVSRAIADDVAAQGVPRAKLSTIHHGIDCERFRPLDEEANTVEEAKLPRPIIGTVARLHPSKGYVVLLEAISMLRGTGFPGTFLFIGEGPQRQELERYVDNYGLRERVHFLGHREDVPELIAACDFIVLPSISEGFGLALLESLACGRTVLASAVGGFEEIAHHFSGVTLFPPGEPNELARSIEEHVQHAESPETREQDIATVRSRFSLESMVKNTERLYERVALKPEKITVLP